MRKMVDGKAFFEGVPHEDTRELLIDAKRKKIPPPIFDVAHVRPWLGVQIFRGPGLGPELAAAAF
jgi:hypothetical protein